MAASILKGLSFPSLVSAAEIDATGSRLISAKNCRIEKISGKNGGISFSRLDAALPFFPADAVSILPHASILEELNDYSLRVAGLATGSYEVRVDGVRIAELSQEQLATGVNLAAAVLKEGPIADQVNAVRVAVENKNRYHHDAIFRGIVLSNFSVPDWLELKITPQEIETQRQAAIAKRMAMLPALDAEVAKTLVMKARIVDIVPIR